MVEQAADLAVENVQLVMLPDFVLFDEMCLQTGGS